jgi:hypothetical protein
MLQPLAPDATPAMGGFYTMPPRTGEAVSDATPQPSEAVATAPFTGDVGRLAPYRRGGSFVCSSLFLFFLFLK